MKHLSRKIVKNGNSLCVNLNKKLLIRQDVKEGDEVDIEVKKIKAE